MRKLRPAEVALLMSAMTIGSASADDGCEISVGCIENAIPLETVMVTGTGFYSPTSLDGQIPQYYILPNGDMLSSNGYDGTISYSPTPLPTQQQQDKIKACVAAYGKYGINPAYNIVYKQFFTWHYPSSTIDLSEPHGTPPNSGNPWYGVAGVTPGTGEKNIYMYEQGWGTNQYGTMIDLFNTLAHEESHTFGADENQAIADANDAVARYQADNGAKCGGPM